jgi:hypothetical protein
MRIVNAWDAATAANADVLVRDFPHMNTCSIRDPNHCPACAAGIAAAKRVFDAVMQDVPDVDFDEIRKALKWREQETGQPPGFSFPIH